MIPKQILKPKKVIHLDFKKRNLLWNLVILQIE